MRKYTPIVVATALAVLVLCAGFLAPVSADAKRFKAFVYTDRTRPELSVEVNDFRINETVWDEGGVQYVWVRGALGNFQLPFSRIRQIEFLKYLGPNTAKQDWAWYEVHVTGKDDNEVYDGRMEIRVMRGLAPGNVPWYLYPVTEMERGRKLWRINIDERTPPTIPWEAPEPPVKAVPVEIVLAPAPPPPPTEDELFARLTLDELNAQAPLGDVFFDFDKWALRPDALQVLNQNATWLKRWPTTKVRIDGCADPRGTNEYNATLGRSRAAVIRDYLASKGIDAGRIEVVAVGEQNLVCSEQTEDCWARNRRGHFYFTAK